MSTSVLERSKAATRPAGGAAHAPRRDIQALRALAVSLVVGYHLFPGRLPGGFVGVDVFFVISGFLITTHLLSRAPRRMSDLAEFWARRIRRLLPASLTVLGVTAVATRLVAPETQWENTAQQIRSAAVYALNWRLSQDAVDYSAADNAASPVQHFWSLSVEEQFYLGWPVLIALLFWLARRGGWRAVTCVRVGLGAVVAVSLAYSIWLTEHNPAGAYFVTPTRIWELGVGGLLAAVIASRPARDAGPARTAPPTVAIVAGLTAVSWSAWTFSGSTPFPGWHAAIPVLGTVAVIAAGDQAWHGRPAAVVGSWPVQRLGDLSYSVYLWHWPTLILLPYVSGGKLGLLDKAFVVVVSVGMAALTKRFIEDPFRVGKPARPLRPFVAAAIGMALVVGIATLQLAEVSHRKSAEDAQLAAALAAGGACFGAPALDAGSPCTASSRQALVPSPAAAVKDRYDQQHKLLGSGKCWASAPAYAVKTCSFGKKEGHISVAVVGNSHAAQWMAPLQRIADRRGWRLTTYFAHNCALADTPQAFATREMTDGCSRWVRAATKSIAQGSFDFVVMSNRMSALAPGQNAAEARPEYETGYRKVLETWKAARQTVIAIDDTPWPHATGDAIPTCLDEHPDQPSACSGPRATWVPDDPIKDAVATVDDRKIQSIELTDHLCRSDTCPGAVGGVIVYSDRSHMTTTYAGSLAPYLDQAISRALRASAHE